MKAGNFEQVSVSVFLKMPPGGWKAASSRGGGSRIQLPTGAPEQQHLVEWCKDIDLVGDDTMPLDPFYTFKDGTRVQQKVRGIKCKTCLLRDDCFDPVIIASCHKRVYVLWERCPHADGTTNGLRCIYCVNWYYGRVRKSRVPPVPMADYEASLGLSARSLQMHIACIINTIIAIIAKGGKHAGHLDFQEIEAKSVTLYQRQKLQKEKPGYLHYERQYYEAQFNGPLETNGCLSKGHRQWVLDGVDGVLVPEAPVTKIKMLEELESCVATEMGSTGNGDTEEAAWCCQ